MTDLDRLVFLLKTNLDLAISTAVNAQADAARAHAGLIDRLRRGSAPLTSEMAEAFDLGHRPLARELGALDDDLQVLAETMRAASRRLADAGIIGSAALPLLFVVCALHGRGLALADQHREASSRLADFYRGFPAGAAPAPANVFPLRRCDEAGSALTGGV